MHEPATSQPYIFQSSNSAQEETVMNHISNSNSLSMKACVENSLNSYLAVKLSNLAEEELKEFVGDIESGGKGKEEERRLQPEFLSQVPQENAREHVLFQEENHARKLHVEELYFDHTQEDLRQRWQVLSQNQDLLWHKKRVCQLFARVMMLLQEKLSCAKEVEKVNQNLSEEKCLDQCSLRRTAAALRHDSSPSVRALNFDVMHKHRKPAPTHDCSQEISKGPFSLESSGSSHANIGLTTSTSSGSQFLPLDRGGVARGPVCSSVGEAYLPLERGIPSKKITSKVPTMSLPQSVEESLIKDPPCPVFSKKEPSQSIRKSSSSERSQVPFHEFKGSSNSSSTQHSSPDSGSPIGPQSFHSEDDENVKLKRTSRKIISQQGQFKTELCKNWEEKGGCPYTANCRFAHGVKELRPVVRHPLYRTQICRMLVEGRDCIYGHRCHFRHI